MTDFIEEVESAFTPRPGGMIDTHRKNRDARRAAAQEQENISERIEEHSLKTVKTSPISPEVLSPYTFTIAAGQYAQILPNSPYRYRSTIMILTAAATAILSKDSGAALGQQGAIWPAGTPLVVFSRAQLWAYNNTLASLQISVLSEIYAPE